MTPHNWTKQASQELDRALEARSAGNEGMARVCARRAAGVIAGEYLRRQGYLSPPPSAVERLKLVAGLPSINPEIRTVTGHFLARVTPDHRLPVEADLIAEARWLSFQLLKVEL